MIDQGLSFCGSMWKFSNGPLHSLFFNQSTYCAINSIDAFHPWIMRIEDICKLSTLEDVAADIPSEWYAGPRQNFANC
jgi:hypothetical protein